MRVAILAAGYGTRLYPLTFKIAKPLLLVNNKPIINFLVDKIKILRKHFPVEEVRIVVNNKFYKSFLIWRKKYRVRAEILNDGSDSPKERLGAVKDIKFAIKKVKADWLILGGDNLFEDNLIKFLKFALEKKPYPSIGLYDVKSKRVARRFGVVMLNRKRRITRLDEKPKEPVSTLVASCIYFFPKQSLDLLYKFIGEDENVDAAGKYIGWLARETKVFGYILEGKWFDIGHFDSLKLAEKFFR